MEPKHVALLRGINVGGRHRLPMKQLVEWFEDAGCREIATYIQSGNVVFAASAARVRALPATISARAAKELGFEVPVVLRSAREWRSIVEANPFRARADEKELHVGFLPERPTKACLARLDPERARPDAFEVRGREIYLSLPGGMARTKLNNAYFDARLETIVTIRNWRTVRSIAELL